MKVFSFSNLGKRTNNEDYLGNNDYCYIVCDGMGGHVSGEIASKFIVDTVLNSTIDKSENFTKPYIQELLSDSQEKMNSLLENEPDLEKMGTTFTGLFKSEEAYFLSHIGDSRTYYIKPHDKLIWHSWDHSLVGELLKKNEITWEKGRTHPLSSRISKAITANKSNKIVKADIAKISSIEKGDIFFLCSDGVTEAWKDHELLALLCDEEIDTSEKLDRISAKCQDDSKDNNTCFLIEIEEEDQINNGDNEDISFKSLQYFSDNYKDHLRKEAEEALSEEEEEISENDNEVVEVVADHDDSHKSDLISINKKSIKKILYFVIAIISIYILFQIFSSNEEIVEDVKIGSKPENSKSEIDKKPNSNAVIIDNKREEEKIESEEEEVSPHMNEEEENVSLSDSIDDEVDSNSEEFKPNSQTIDSIMIKK